MDRELSRGVGSAAPLASMAADANLEELREAIAKAMARHEAAVCDLIEHHWGRQQESRRPYREPRPTLKLPNGWRRQPDQTGFPGTWLDDSTPAGQGDSLDLTAIVVCDHHVDNPANSVSTTATGEVRSHSTDGAVNHDNLGDTLDALQVEDGTPTHALAKKTCASDDEEELRGFSDDDGSTLKKQPESPMTPCCSESRIPSTPKLSRRGRMRTTSSVLLDVQMRQGDSLDLTAIVVCDHHVDNPANSVSTTATDEVRSHSTDGAVNHDNLGDTLDALQVEDGTPTHALAKKPCASDDEEELRGFSDDDWSTLKKQPESPMTPYCSESRIPSTPKLSRRGRMRTTSSVLLDVQMREQFKKVGIHRQPISFESTKKLRKQRTWLQNVMSGTGYEVFTMILVLLNCMYIGYQVQDYAIRSSLQLERSHSSTLEMFFLVTFSVDQILRLLAFGEHFCRSTDWHWNIFDLGVVSMMWFELVLGKMAGSQDGEDAVMISQMSTLRILRLMRIVRILRIIRVLRFFREFRLMLSSMLNSMLALFWAMMLLGAMFFIFGLSLTQGTVDFLNGNNGWQNPRYESLRVHFGRLDTSALSLFEAMAGGISWGELIDDLMPLTWNYAALFLVFISVSMFAVLNIVTGVFVQTALERSQTDTESMIQDTMSSKETYLKKMHEIFQEADIDCTGTVTLQELTAAMADERMAAYLDALGLPAEEVETLFLLLDKDQTGWVDSREFLQGCMHLKGPARGLDVATLQMQSEWLMRNMRSLQRSLKRSNSYSVSELSSISAEIRKLA